MLIENDDNLTYTLTNKTMRERLQKAELGEYVYVHRMVFFTSYMTKTLQATEIPLMDTKWFYCILTVNVKEDNADKNDNVKIKEKEEVTPHIPRGSLLPYREYPNLTTLLICSVHKLNSSSQPMHHYPLLCQGIPLHFLWFPVL